MRLSPFLPDQIHLHWRLLGVILGLVSIMSMNMNLNMVEAGAIKGDLGGAVAGEAVVGSIRISGAHVRPMAAGVTDAFGFLDIENKGRQDDHLIAVTSPVSARVDLLAPISDGQAKGVDPSSVHERAIGAVVIPAGEIVYFETGAWLLEFVDVHKSFAVGDEIIVRMNFAHAGAVDVVFDVIPLVRLLNSLPSP